MQAIILAAGYATRMYPLTKNTPKPLLPLRGKPVIDHIVEQLNTLPDVENIYVVTNSKFFGKFTKWQPPGKIPVEIIDDGTSTNDDRRGAVGDVVFAIREKNIDDEIVIIAGDNYFTFDLRKQFEMFRETGCDTLCGKALEDRAKLHNFGIAVLADNGKLIHFEEKPREPKSNIVIYAAYFFTRETTALFETYLAEGNSPDNIGSFPQWLYNTRDVYTYRIDGECHDIGSIEAYDALNN